MTAIPFAELPRPNSTDSLPLPATSIDMLDLALVERHIEQASKLGRYRGPDDPLTYLSNTKCLVEVDGQHYATLAGLLCFGRNPQELMSHTVVDLGHYRGVEQISFEVAHLEKNIGGTLFDQMARIENYLWLNIHHGMTVAQDSFKRVDLHEYPQIVIRELCANMLAHRDYYHATSHCRVMLFRDRIEWVSPGGLPPGLTIENILNEQAARNPVILTIFYEAGYVEAFGQGLDTVVAVLKAENMVPPLFHDTGQSFIVGVYGRTPDAFTSDGAVLQLNENQRKILTLVRQKGDVASKEVYEHCHDRPRRSLQRDIAALLDAGLIEVSGNTRAARYRPGPGAEDRI
jgi:predicted HTH transcriptional regulator